MFELGGSSCILERKDGDVIRKISSTKDYNDRLKEQMFKQMEFLSVNKSINVDAPLILNSGVIEDSGLFFFDMEYIRGNIFVEHMPFLSTIEVHRIGRTFCEYFDDLILRSKLYKSDELESAVGDKLEELKKNSDHVEFIEYLQKQEVGPIMKSKCHGDLTFSNMIFFGKKIYLIDFLDSFVDSFLIDFVKLKQDLYYRWSFYLSGIPSYYVLRVKQVFYYLWSVLQGMYKDFIDTHSFRLLESINFLRIEPYVTGIKKEHLNRIIKETPLYEKFDNTNGRRI